MKALTSLLPLFALLLLFACASTPTAPQTGSTTAKTATSAPDWTSRTTFLDGTSLVFVVSGPETAEIPALAFAAMQSYLDLPVGPTTPVVAAKAIQEFLQSMSLTKPADHYSKDGKGFWKIALAKDDWDKARSGLQALVDQAAADPSLALEKAADDLLRQGRPFEAVSGFVAAAQTALTDGKSVPRYRSNLSRAQEIVDRFVLTSPTAAQTTRVGQAFANAFEVKLTYGAGAQAPVVPGALLRFSYKVKKNGHIATTGQTIKTDAQGRVQFELPVPDFAVQDSVVVVVDVNPWLEALASVPKDQRDPVGGFETTAAEHRLLLPYAVESAAKQVPMIVALADFDDRGGVQRSQESAKALIAGLQKNGFQASGLQINLSLLKSTNDNVILAAWKFQGRTTGRAVYGTVALVSVTPSGTKYTAEVAGNLKVADLATSKPVYQYSNSQVSTAADKAGAIAQAYREWAANATESLTTDLP